LCSASTTTQVVVNPSPVINVVSTNGVSCVGLCDGDVTVTATVGTAPFLYLDGNFNFSASGIFTDNQCEGNGQLINMVDDNGCFSNNVSYNIGHISTVPPSISVPNPPITGLPVSACNGSTASISTAVVPLATQYNWDGPVGTTFSNANPYSSTTPSVNILFGSPNGSGYYIGVQAANGCGASNRRVQWVRGTVSVPASVTGVLTACPNTSVNYSTAAVTGATQYLWTITGDATVSGTGTTATVNFGPAFTTGTLCVAAQTACYTSATKCITISNTASVITQINGTFLACPGQTLTYSVAPVAGAASYIWTLPAGATGSSNTNSINATFSTGFIGGNITVQVSSTCGVLSPVKSKTINSGVPPAPASVTGPLTGMCGQTAIYQCPSQSGVTFTWTVPAGATINSGQNTNAISVTFGTFGTGSVCVTATTSCGTSTPRCVTVKGAPNAPGAITAIPSSWCANTAGVEFDVDVTALTGSYTLSWLYPNATIASYVLGGGNSTSLIMNWLTGSGPVNVTAANACGNATRTSTQASTCRESFDYAQDDNLAGNNVSVYPNPTSGNVNIEFSSVTKGDATISVMDISGRTIATQNVAVVEGLNKTQLDLSNVSKGIYMLNVNSENENAKIKIVIQ
jgi:Secretion system C-terminal sorting domain/PKD-like domain